jgi:hypothetical protein
MAALAAFRDTPSLTEVRPLRSYPVKAGAKIFAGSLVALNAGFAAPMAVATGRIAVGKAIGPAPGTGGSLAGSTVDNTSGNDGDQTVLVEEGVHRWGNSASGDLIAQANVGAQCFGVDDQTVALTNGSSSRSVAGLIIKVDTAGVWVQTGMGQNT